MIILSLDAKGSFNNAVSSLEGDCLFVIKYDYKTPMYKGFRYNSDIYKGIRYNSEIFFCSIGHQSSYVPENAIWFNYLVSGDGHFINPTKLFYSHEAMLEYIQDIDLKKEIIYNPEFMEP